MNIFALKYFGIFFLVISFFSFFNIIYTYYFNLLNNLGNYIFTFVITLIIGLFLLIFKKYRFEKINLFERIIIGLYFLFSILLLIDLFDENLKRSLTNYISLNSSEIFKQYFKIIIIYLFMTILIFIMLKLVNLRSYDSYNYALTIISSGGFLPNDNFDNTFSTDISKIILSISMC